MDRDMIICLDLCLYPDGEFTCSICYVLALFVVSSNSRGNIFFISC